MITHYNFIVSLIIIIAIIVIENLLPLPFSFAAFAAIFIRFFGWRQILLFLIDFISFTLP